jgi:hypothetical protein
LGLPLLRFALLHLSRSAGFKGRDWSATNGSSKSLVASASSWGFISQYGFAFISSPGDDVAVFPDPLAVAHESRMKETIGAVNRKSTSGALPFVDREAPTY